MRNENFLLLATNLTWPNIISWTSKFPSYLIKPQSSLITPSLWITRKYPAFSLTLNTLFPFFIYILKNPNTRTVCLIVSTCWGLDLSVSNTVLAQVSSSPQGSPPGCSIGFSLWGGCRTESTLDGNRRLHSLAVRSELPNGWVPRWQTYSSPLYSLAVGSSESPQLPHLCNENNTPYTQPCWQLEWNRWAYAKSWTTYLFSDSP